MSRRFLLLAAGLAGVLVTALTASPATAAAEHAQPAQSHKKEFLTVGLTHAAKPSRPTRTNNLTYHGGRVSSKGVRVYVVYWGSQWGTSTDSSGAPTTDPTQAAHLQADFFRHVGGTGDTWSNSTTQYCDGVALGTVNCSSVGNHVVKPSQNVLAGQWLDTSSSPVTNATDASIAAEALKAAAYFGDYSDGVQYIVDFPHGVYPNGFAALSGGTYCAWHDSTTAANGSTIAFTNMPYVSDAGTSCGAGFVAPSGGVSSATEGVTIVGGHEYAETITDQWPSSTLAWVDSRTAENGDKCAWVSSGTGASKVIAINGTSYAMQTLWSNLANGCVMTS